MTELIIPSIFTGNRHNTLPCSSTSVTVLRLKQSSTERTEKSSTSLTSPDTKRIPNISFVLPITYVCYSKFNMYTCFSNMQGDGCCCYGIHQGMICWQANSTQQSLPNNPLTLIDSPYFFETISPWKECSKCCSFIMLFLCRRLIT